MEFSVKVRECAELYNSPVAGIKFNDAGTTIAIAQIIYAVRPVVESYETQRKELLEKYGKLDPDTQELVVKDRDVQFKTPQDRKTFEAEHKKLLDAITTVTVPKLDGNRINGEGLTPIVLLVLIPFGLRLADQDVTPTAQPAPAPKP